VFLLCLIIIQLLFSRTLNVLELSEFGSEVLQLYWGTVVLGVLLILDLVLGPTVYFLVNRMTKMLLLLFYFKYWNWYLLHRLKH